MMDPALALERKVLSRQDEMNAVINQFASPVQKFYAGATVFVTGGSGFVGKQLIEKLFRSTKINKVYILIRSKRGVPIQERVIKILEDPVYDTLHTNQPNFGEKIIPMEGDVTHVELGLNDANKKIISETVDVIFHVAASVRFDEPLTKATIINVRGTKETLALAKQCKKLRALVHISTAFSHATSSRIGTKVLEEFYPCPISPDVLLYLAEHLEENRFDSMKSEFLHDWPNTYCFTKALAEDLIRSSAKDLPVCIMRPSIVICTNCEPNPGWIDMSSVYGPSGVALGCSTGTVHTMICRGNVKTDLVPTDFVNNAAIVAAWETHKRWKDGDKKTKIYTIASSARCHLTFDFITSVLTKTVRATVASPNALWYCFLIGTSNDWIYMVLHFVLQDVPAAIIDIYLVLTKRPARLKKLYSTWYKSMGVFKYFFKNEWIFDDHNTIEMYQKLSDEDRAIYNFDVAKIDWMEQILMWCTGLRKYILKDGLKNTAWGIRKQQYLKMVTYIMGGFICICLVYLFIISHQFLKSIFKYLQL